MPEEKEPISREDLSFLDKKSTSTEKTFIRKEDFASQIQQLEQRINDTIDKKLNQKSKLEIVTMPLAVVLITVIGSLIISFSTTAITNANIKKDRAIAKQQQETQKNLQAVELFQKLITAGNTKREKEMAVRILNTIEPKLAFQFAYAIATNRSEDKDIAYSAFLVGKQMNQAGFLKKIMGSMNIVLVDENSDNRPEDVEKWLSDYDTGYPQLVEKIYLLMDRKAFYGRSVGIDMINGINQNEHHRGIIYDISEIENEKLSNALLQSWRKRNRSSRGNQLSECTF